MGQLLSLGPPAESSATRHELLAAECSKQVLQERRRFARVLVLGLEGSGKSLFVSQLASSFKAPPFLLSGCAAGDQAAAAVMQQATLACGRQLAAAALASGEAFASPEAAAGAQLLLEAPASSQLTPALSEAVVGLWSGGGRAVALAWDSVASQCSDNMNYLVRRARAAAARGFQPTTEDRLRLHLPTRFPMRTLLRERWDKHVVHVVELPSGVVAEAPQLARACAVLQESATALVFCVALADFDRTLHDPATGLLLQPPRNRLVCALDAWAAVAASPHFRHAHLTLLLTKLDAFGEKLKTQDLRHPGSATVPPRFLDYRGGPDQAAALSYLEGRFHERAAGRTPQARIQAVNLLDPTKVGLLCGAFKEKTRQVMEELLQVLDTN